MRGIREGLSGCSGLPAYALLNRCTPLRDREAQFLGPDLVLAFINTLTYV